jgi:hypothetical protein
MPSLLCRCWKALELEVSPGPPARAAGQRRAACELPRKLVELGPSEPLVPVLPERGSWHHRVTLPESRLVRHARRISSSTGAAMAERKRCARRCVPREARRCGPRSRRRLVSDATRSHGQHQLRQFDCVEGLRESPGGLHFYRYQCCESRRSFLSSRFHVSVFAQHALQQVHPCSLSGVFSPNCNSQRKISGSCANAAHPVRRHGRRTRDGSSRSFSRQNSSATVSQAQSACPGFVHSSQ